MMGPSHWSDVPCWRPQSCRHGGGQEIKELRGALWVPWSLAFRGNENPTGLKRGETLVLEELPDESLDLDGSE